MTGERRISPSDARAYVGEIIRVALDLIPEESRAEFAEQVAPRLDRLEAATSPVQAGDTILSREAAFEEIRRDLDRFLDERKRGEKA